MIFLESVRLATIPAADAQSFPFSVPVVRSLTELRFDADVTFLVGENGSGKSTLLEAIAAAANLPTIGSDDVARDPTLAEVRKLARKLKLGWRTRTPYGFFMRAEDVFGFAKRAASMRRELERDLAEVEQEFAGKEAYARNFARMPMLRELGDLKQRYGDDLDARSHGESYFTLFGARFVPNGLFLMDEPEAPLSPQRQLALIAMLRLMVAERNAQFIIATHSPMLMAYPGATIYALDNGRLETIAYDDVDHVRLMRGFMQNPAQFLRHL